MIKNICRVLVTGSNGFIAKNLIVRMSVFTSIKVSTFVRGDEIAILPHLVANADVIVHLAGENRPANNDAFLQINYGLTFTLCNAVKREYELTGRRVTLILASSTQALLNNSYGLSKLEAERVLQDLSESTGNPCVIFRLPGVFGKWCKPNYNSVVATFCHNIARDLPIQINDPNSLVNLVYVDDVVDAILNSLETTELSCVVSTVKPNYCIGLGDLAKQIQAFRECRHNLIIEPVGTGLVRALYATYVSYTPKENFSYDLPVYTDSRGVFVEVLKTFDSGQFSYLTAPPGITRGGHYHHTKTEKFLVIKGEGLFRFRNLLSNELVELRTTGTTPQVVDTIPGWVHDITNVGEEEMVVLLWANENFDRENPDTVISRVEL
jgi:UDP-2-acetamido-2,6-beta-L-arabino-hexul-4-ose reductase